MTTRTNKELIEELSEQNKVLMEQLERLRTEMREGKQQADRDVIGEAISVLSDPYDLQSPFRITKDIPPDDEYPEGQVLRWLGVRWRESRTLRGWKPLQWGDKYTGKHGEKLREYIGDPPERMQGPDQIDSYIRRGDTFLGRLDKRIWHARRAKPVLEDARRLGGLQEGQTVKLGTGVYLTGDGIKKDTEITKREERSGPDIPFDKESGTGAHRTELPVE